MKCGGKKVRVAKIKWKRQAAVINSDFGLQTELQWLPAGGVRKKCAHTHTHTRASNTQQIRK